MSGTRHRDGATGRRTENGWCILTTSGARTLPLAASLREAGFEVYTPTRTAHIRKPRRPGKIVKQVPMAPTFVFARWKDLDELLAISRLPVSHHPSFSFFRFNGQYPEVSNAEIERVREKERRAVPTRQRPTIPVGSAVRPDEGPYAGMSGVVRRSDGKYTLVAFGGWMEVQIETFLISPNAVLPSQPKGIAA